MPNYVQKSAEALEKAEDISKKILQIAVDSEQPLDPANVAVAQLYATIGLGYATLASADLS